MHVLCYVILSSQTYSWILSAQIFSKSYVIAVLFTDFCHHRFIHRLLSIKTYAEIISISVLLGDVSLQTKSCFLSSQTYLQILSSQTSQNK